VLALAALASLAVHIALLQSTIRLPDRVEEPAPLLATITELPPPPAPAETVAPRPPKPKHRRVVRAAPPVRVESPDPEPAGQRVRRDDAWASVAAARPSRPAPEAAAAR